MYIAPKTMLLVLPVVLQPTLDVLLDGVAGKGSSRDRIDLDGGSVLFQLCILVGGQHLLLHLGVIFGRLRALQHHDLDNLVFLDMNLDRCGTVVPDNVLCQRCGVDNVRAVLPFFHHVICLCGHGTQERKGNH